MRNRSSSSRIAELDGLRGVAIFLVLLFHYISNSAGGDFGGILYRFRSLFRMGWSGVDLFFVLSGFLIGGILLEVRSSPKYFRTFYLRRAHRIIPIYFLWLSLYPIASWLVQRWQGSPLPVDPALSHHLPLFYLFAQTLVDLRAGTLGWFWLAVTWSVAVEEQFYLIAAPVVRFLSERRLVYVLAGAIAICPLLRWMVYSYWPDLPSLAYVLMPCRADSLAIGILAAMAWRSPTVRGWLAARRTALYATFYALLAGVAVFLKWYPSPYSRTAILVEYPWLAVMYASLLLLVLLDPPGSLAGVMRWGWLRELGRVSYCVYLIHLPILGMCTAILGHSARTHIDTVPGIAATLLAAAITLGLARMSWIYFENPLVRRGHAYSYDAPAATNASFMAQPQPLRESD